MSLSEKWAKGEKYIKYILFQNTFRVSTWLVIGASIQTLSMWCLPLRVSSLLPLLVLFQRLVQSFIDERRIFSTLYTNVRRGRWTAKLPEEKDGDGVVVFVLGARINHPQGRVVAGGVALAKYLNSMWAEAEKNRVKWGYLGRTPTMADCLDEEGQTFVWITYWKDLKGLHEFSNNSVHRLGIKAYRDDKMFPYVGIMHETYYCQTKSGETLYNDFPPFGLGSCKLIVKGTDGACLSDPLVPDQTGGSSMFERMGRRDM